MPDWEQIVTERLGRLRLSPQARREVISELAAHLEDQYSEACAAGCPDPLGETLAQLAGWESLGTRIRQTREDPMSYRQQVSIPGVVALVFSGVSQILVLRGLVSWQRSNHWDYPAQSATLLWLFTFVLAGSVGAAFARRALAGPRRRLLAAIYPSFLMPVIYVVVWVVSRFSSGPGILPLLGLWLTVTVACALGALPWMFGASRSEQPQPPATA
jgi:hypothetical protein